MVFLSWGSTWGGSVDICAEVGHVGDVRDDVVLNLLRPPDTAAHYGANPLVR